MIAVLKSGTGDKQIADLKNWIEAQGLQVHLSKGRNYSDKTQFRQNDRAILFSQRLWREEYGVYDFRNGS